MKKIITVLFFVLIIFSEFAFANENEYVNESVNDGLFYTGKVIIYPGEKRYHNIWEVESNTVTGVKQQVIVKCISKTKAYMNYKSTEEENTQYLINENCEFLASGKIENKWIYIKVSSDGYRWIPVEKITFSNGSINDLPELIFKKSYGNWDESLFFYKNFIHINAQYGFDFFGKKGETVNAFFSCNEISKNKLNFISFNNRTYLILKNENLLYLIDENNREKCNVISGFSVRKLEGFLYAMPSIFSASSELKEKDIIYSAKNLDNVNGAKPWVEASKGDGIGEYIIIDYIGIIGLIISNGYVDFNKSNLYENNNRVKGFEVYNQDNKLIQEIELEDTPDPQVFKIKEKCESIKLVIKEVYKGNKWDDTCINFIKIIPDSVGLDGFIYK